MSLFEGPLFGVGLKRNQHENHHVGGSDLKNDTPISVGAKIRSALKASRSKLVQPPERARSFVQRLYGEFETERARTPGLGWGSLGFA